MVRIYSFVAAITLACLGNTSFADERLVERFVNLGVNGTQLELDTNTSAVPDESDFDAGFYMGAGIRKLVSASHWYGARVEIDDIHGDMMLSLRAIDYQYQLDDSWRIGAFLGASRLDTGAATTGYYAGTGVLYQNLYPNADLGFDLRYGDNLARDKLLAGDPAGGGPDIYYDIYGFSLYLSWRL